MYEVWPKNLLSVRNLGSDRAEGRTAFPDCSPAG